MDERRVMAESREHRAERKEQGAVSMSSTANTSTSLSTRIPPSLGDVAGEQGKGIEPKADAFAKALASVESTGVVIPQIINRYQQISIPDDRDARSPWIVVRTKTKCEKFIRDRLQVMGLEAFVPLRKRTAKYSRKVKVYELPLITGYTFVRLDKTRRNQVLALPYVQGVLRIAGHDCIVSDREIQWLQKISGTDIDVKTETLSMQKGDRVVLASGQLAGMEGVIVSQRSKHEMIVALESIGMQMVIQVDTSVLEHAW